MSGSLLGGTPGELSGYGGPGWLAPSGPNGGSNLLRMLAIDAIVPGLPASYQACKEIFLFHPLGARMASGPISLAQSQRREITLEDDPDDLIKKEFLRVWKDLDCDMHIFATARNARIYGHAATVAVAQGVAPNRPLDPKSFAKTRLVFNDYDPLKCSASMNMNQDPNQVNFLKMDQLVVNGVQYHPSRGFMLLNEDPVYLAYTSSGFGYTGRSVYQRALYPLQSFLQSMITDNMVCQKAGLLVTKTQQEGSIMDNLMASITGTKRALIQMGTTGNVLSIGPEDDIQSIDLKNIDGALITARKNVLDNIAVAADMPSKLLDSKSYAAGFGEGTEDAKSVAQYISRVRLWLRPLYEWFDQIVMFRAWTPEFFDTLQKAYPDTYGSMGYLEAFYGWKNSFKWEWPNLLEEPESEKVKIDETRFKSALGIVQTALPVVGNVNRARALNFLADVVNEQRTLFNGITLEFDQDELMTYEPPRDATPDELAPPKVPKPTAKNRMK